VTGLIGDRHVSRSPVALDQAGDNCQALSRHVLGILSPEDQRDVIEIVKAANRHRVSLYPISRGENVGYGGITPVMNNQFVLNLSRLDRILDFDDVNGEVTVEPGVTQEQLCHFLKEQGGRYWADVTGASPQASILGNTLEAGFGHTPLGDHRHQIVEMEVVLGSGRPIRSGEFPNLGPNISGLFIQSNFGVVTKLRIPLFAAPERVTSYILQFEDDHSFHAAIPSMKRLYQQGAIASLLHIANSTRLLMTRSKFPAELDRSRVLTAEHCLELLNRGPIKAGMWTAIGGLYGSKREIKLKVKRINRALKRHARVTYLSEQKIARLLKICSLPGLKRLNFIREARRALDSIGPLHGLIRGEPTNMPNENILWRTSSREDLGLIWYAPVLPSTPGDVKNFYQISRGIFQKHGFEMPVTLTMINQKQMIAVMNFSFDRTCASDRQRAHSAHRDLAEAMESQGYHPYRMGLLRAQTHRYSEDKQFILEALKKSLDPNNVISPGRYGIARKPGDA
jgi:4-cresol dehydrogenase (hydroxylating)